MTLSHLEIKTALDRHVGGVFRLLEEFPQGVPFWVVELGVVTLVDHDLNHDFDWDSNPVWMVFKIDGSLYKITGYKDSYGGSSWTGEFRKVSESTETVKKWTPMDNPVSSSLRVTEKMDRGSNWTPPVKSVVTSRAVRSDRLYDDYPSAGYVPMVNTENYGYGGSQGYSSPSETSTYCAPSSSGSGWSSSSSSDSGSSCGGGSGE